MNVPHWIWALRTVGVIAVINLAAFGLLGVLHMALFPEGVIRVDQEPGWRIAVPGRWKAACSLWRSQRDSGRRFLHARAALGSRHFFVPLNAYFWGWIGDALGTTGWHPPPGFSAGRTGPCIVARSGMPGSIRDGSDQFAHRAAHWHRPRSRHRI